MSPVSSDEPDLAHYKMMLRSSVRDQDDSLNRSQEFLGSNSTFSPRTSIKKPTRLGVTNSGDRPDDWLGSPASKRKSYTIKGSSTTDSKSPATGMRHSIAVSSLNGSSIPAVELSPTNKSLTGRPPIGISRHTIKGQTANTKADSVLEESHSPESITPSGITRHTLGGSSSHHKSTSMPEEPSPNPEYYKTILRASMQGGGTTRSQDFLGGSDHDIAPGSPHGHFAKPPPKPILPISPDRPTEWLGSPASCSRKSYTIKEHAVESIPNLDDDDDDDDPDNVQLPPEIIAVATSRQARPIKSQSIAIGASPPVRASPTKKSGPRAKSQSLSLGQRAPWEASPVGEHERVDRGKFVTAFSIFENSKPDLHAVSTDIRSPHSPKFSPFAGTRRNFTISDDAKRRSLALSLDSSSSPEKTNPNDELQSVVARLRKVTLAPGSSTVGPKDASWLQRIRQLRITGAKEYSDMLQNLQDRGLVSSNLGPQRMDQVRQAIVRLEQVRKHNPKAQKELSTVLDMHLRKLTPTSAGSFGSIQQAIARLRKVEIDDRSGVEEVISTLDSVLESMQEGQEAQLAEALSSINDKEEAIPESEEQPQEQPVKQTMEKAPRTPSPEKKDNKQQKIRFAKSRISPQDADFLVQALLKLKKVNLSKQEAGKIAGFIRHLNPVEGSNGSASSSDEAFSNLSKQLEQNENSGEIMNVLNGLRKIRLNDPECAELAEVVRGLGKGYKHRNEIADAISKLRKVQFTPSEAKEAAGIMFNLRKVKKRVTFNLDQSREMVNLRKVMLPEKANAVADAFMELSKADLSEKEMDELTGAVVDLGVVPLSQDDCKLISVEYHDGRPVMVLNIPEGEEYLEHLKETEVADCIKAETTGTTGDVRFSVNVDRVASDDESLGEDRVSEQGIITDMDSPSKPKMVVKIRKSMPSPKPSPIVSPKRASAKKLHHYGDGQNDETGPLDEVDEKKIKFSHKPHWRHKKHNNTVVNEKRWRFEEDFNADEVIWSPLSREQYDRRKTVGASILKSMMEFAPLDDMVLDEYEEDAEQGTKKK